MQYKTIILELLQQRPEIHEQLRKDRKLLPTVELYARELKTSHEAWKETLGEAGQRPEPDRERSMEMALKEVEDRLPSASHPGDNEPLSLDAAMAFIRNHTSPG